MLWGSKMANDVLTVQRVSKTFMPNIVALESGGLILHAPIYKNATLPSMRQSWMTRHSLQKQRTMPVLKSLSTKYGRPEQAVIQLSGDNQQKVVLAKWIINGTHVLLLDEPSRGLDIGAKADLNNLVDKLAEDGAAVIVASSELEELYAACDVGTACGAAMGAISALAQVPSFIVTLAGLVSFRGITYLMTDGVPVSGLPQGFAAIGSTMVPILPGFAVSSMGLIFIVLCILAGLVLRLTVFGEYVFATGGNPEAARLSGLPTRFIVTAVFAVSAFMAALGGILLTSRLRIGQPTAAQGLELDAIAAVVLGGTSLFGGRGGVLGTFFVVMLLQVLRNIFNLLGLGSFYQMTVTGITIVAAILLNRFIDHRKGRG